METKPPTAEIAALAQRVVELEAEVHALRCALAAKEDRDTSWEEVLADWKGRDRWGRVRFVLFHALLAVICIALILGALWLLEIIPGEAD